jgi:hypothetical protein
MELPPETLTWLNRKAYILVQSVMRHMHMDASERQMFREDMTQEALSHLYDLSYLQGHPEAYAYTATRTRLIGYVFVNIRGGGSGHQWELSKQYQISDNLTEPEYHEEDSYGQKAPRLPMSIYARRPTEDALVLHEGTAANEARWERFEKEIARILAVMRGQQWHPNSLRRAAKALCESVKGTSNYNIAQMLGVDWITATQIIIHYREQLDAFLAHSPLIQGLILAEGALRLQWWEESPKPPSTAASASSSSCRTARLPSATTTARARGNTSAGCRWGGGSMARCRTARYSWGRWGRSPNSGCGTSRWNSRKSWLS